jgi:uncharacterized protein (TIGR03663 family)
MAKPVFVSMTTVSSRFYRFFGGIRARMDQSASLRCQEWWGVAGAIMVTGTLLRLYQLTLKPLHHDEGVNGLFLLGLFREGIYRYNAANYHGPTLYYFALITSSVNNLLTGAEGPSTVAIRLVPVLFGSGLLGLLLTFRQRLGNVGTLTAASLIACSPGSLFVSRDFIHETLLVFFTLWLVVCSLHFWDTNKTKPLMLASIAAALMFSTKETALISVVALGVGLGFVLVWIPGHRKLNAADWGGRARLCLLALASAALFLSCSFLFFSSFLGNYPQGIRDAITTYSYWAHTGMVEHTAAWYTYGLWLVREEAPIFVLGIAGTALALFQRRNRFAVFVGAWAGGLLLVYSALPYKTPWILPNMLLPMSLAAGHLAQKLWDSSGKLLRGTFVRPALAALLFFSLAVSFYQAVQLNFIHYDDDRYVYPYAQTRRGFLDLIVQLDEIAGRTGGKQTTIAVVTTQFWPLPWYLRDYKNVGYYDHVIPTSSTVVIASPKQITELMPSLAGRYRLAGSYPLRPGAYLLLFVANNELP